MARMTASDFISFTRLGVAETSETLSDAQLLRLINQSYFEICGAFNFPELDTSEDITTAASTAEYTMSATDVLYINDVVDTTNGLQLREINQWQYNQFTQSNTTSGNAVYWYPSGESGGAKQLTFFPTPSGVATVTVYYRKLPSELVTTPSATSAIIPQIWDESILHRAISRAWRLLGDLSKSQKWMEAVRESDMIASKTAQYGSRVPMISGSIVGRAGDR